MHNTYSRINTTHPIKRNYAPVRELSDFEKEQISINKITSQANRLSAIAAIAGVALGAIGIGIALLAYTHSVRIEQIKIRPALEFHFGDNNSETLLSIKNAGLGPAIILGMKFENLDKNYEAVDRPLGDDFSAKVIWILGLNDFVQNAPDSESFSVRMPTKGTVLGANTSVEIINYRGYQERFMKMRRELKRKFDDFFILGNITVEYCSIDGYFCTTSSAKY